jgi:hypothetical protein
MPQPDWAKEQHADERSPFHGLGEHGPQKDKDGHVHGPHEHPLGAKEEHPQGKGKPFIAPTDAGLAMPDGVTEDTPEGEILATVGSTLPSLYTSPYLPPVLDQGSTPQCVAYSSSYDQNQEDRPEGGRFFNFNKALFFKQIGGTSNGASMTAALSRRQQYGYPTVSTVGDAPSHRIASSLMLARTVTAMKSAITSKHKGILRIGPWFHSWFHPLLSGKLPAPDYLVGWHATFVPGFYDLLGGYIENSWGTDYGRGGFVYMPYTYMVAAGSMWVTTDR